MVAPAGIEPATFSLGNCCSIHLSYGARLDDAKLSHVSLAARLRSKLLMVIVSMLEKWHGKH